MTVEASTVSALASLLALGFVAASKGCADLLAKASDSPETTGLPQHFVIRLVDKAHWCVHTVGPGKFGVVAGDELPPFRFPTFEEAEGRRLTFAQRDWWVVEARAGEP